MLQEHRFHAFSVENIAATLTPMVGRRSLRELVPPYGPGRFAFGHVNGTGYLALTVIRLPLASSPLGMRTSKTPL